MFHFFELRRSYCRYRLSLLVQPLQKNISLAKWVQPAEISVEPGLGFLHTEPWQVKQQNKEQSHCCCKYSKVIHGLPINGHKFIIQMLALPSNPYCKMSECFCK